MRGRRQLGFSLLEMLVALLVIVLATSLAVLNVGSGDRDILLDSAVKNIADSANYALDEAQFTGVDYGLLLRVSREDGLPRYRYRWLERGEDRWRQPASGKEIFDTVRLPPGIELQLEVEGVLQPEEGLVESGETGEPQLVLYASGETLPGAIDIRAEDDGHLLWRVEWSLLGDFRALREGLPDAGELP